MSHHSVQKENCVLTKNILVLSEKFIKLECQNDVCNFFEYKFVSHGANKNEKI